jgi:hypothetical protein
MEFKVLHPFNFEKNNKIIKLVAGNVVPESDFINEKHIKAFEKEKWVEKYDNKRMPKGDKKEVGK